MRNRIARAGTAAALVFCAWIVAGTAHATECGATEESGIWVNPHAAQKSLARLEIKTVCTAGHHGWRVRALVRCSRTECSWGYAEGVRRPDGALAALFETFSADRLVRMSVDRDMMHVAVVNAFRNARPNSVARYVFERQYDE